MFALVTLKIVGKNRGKHLKLKHDSCFWSYFIIACWYCIHNRSSHSNCYTFYMFKLLHTVYKSTNATFIFLYFSLVLIDTCQLVVLKGEHYFYKDTDQLHSTTVSRMEANRKVTMFTSLFLLSIMSLKSSESGLLVRWFCFQSGMVLWRSVAVFYNVFRYLTLCIWQFTFRKMFKLMAQIHNFMQNLQLTNPQGKITSRDDHRQRHLAALISLTVNMQSNNLYHMILNMKSILSPCVLIRHRIFSLIICHRWILESLTKYEFRY